MHSVTPYTLRRSTALDSLAAPPTSLLPRDRGVAAHLSIRPLLIFSPPRVTHRSDGSGGGGPTAPMLSHSAGVLHTCVVRVALSVSPIASRTFMRDGKHSVAPASRAVHASPMQGSKDTAVASSTRDARPTPCARAFATAYDRSASCRTATPFGLPVEPLV